MRAGCQQTDIGAIPTDWKLSSVGAEFDVKLGKMLDAERNTGTPMPYLGNRAVQWDRIDHENLPTVPMTRADIERYRLQEGDLLVCEGGEVGRAALWRAPTKECYYQKALHRLRPLQGFDVRLMPSLLRLWSDRGILANYVTQTSIAHLPREKFLEVPIPVPPPAEQRAIANALEDVGLLIESLERLIAKKRDIKQAAMQQLLTGMTRLPGFLGDWASLSLGNSAVLKARIGWQGLTTAEYRTSGGYHLVTGTEIHDGQVDWASCFFVDKERYEQDRHIQLRPNDVLVTKDGTIGKAALIRELPSPATLNSGLFVIRPVQNAFDPGFFFRVLRSECFRTFLNQLAAGSTINHLYQKDFVHFVFNAPTSLGEQRAIARVLDDMDSELALLGRQMQKLRDIKRGMMQQLLTGKVRLL